MFVGLHSHLADEVQVWRGLAWLGRARTGKERKGSYPLIFKRKIIKMRRKIKVKKRKKAIKEFNLWFLKENKRYITKLEKDIFKSAFNMGYKSKKINKENAK